MPAFCPFHCSVLAHPCASFPLFRSRASLREPFIVPFSRILARAFHHPFLAHPCASFRRSHLYHALFPGEQGEQVNTLFLKYIHTRVCEFIKKGVHLFGCSYFSFYISIGVYLFQTSFSNYPSTGGSILVDGDTPICRSSSWSESNHRRKVGSDTPAACANSDLSFDLYFSIGYICYHLTQKKGDTELSP